ncbi:MAG: esterase/lipase family protein [Acidimicrobiales bacterium]
MGQERRGGRARVARLVVAVSLCTIVIGAAAVVPAAASVRRQSVTPHRAKASLPLESEVAAFLGVLTNPTASPPGANNASCKPSSAHPYPVILVPGTFASMADSFGAISPALVNEGYCVYSFNYGQTLTGRPFYGTGEIGASAGELETFVDQVLAETGASKVDLVGHSQGGMMPRYYIKYLGGASKVNMLVGLAPSNNGTTLDDIATVFRTLFGELGLDIVSSACEACTEQIKGSSFLDNLNSGGETVSGVKYVVIESIFDEVVTPYTSAFLPAASNVQNITLQDQCPLLDYADHISIIYDSNALQDIENALGADKSNFHPSCSYVGALVGDD